MLPLTFLVLFSTYNNLSFTCRFYCVCQLVYLCYAQVSAGRDHFSVHVYIPMHIGFEQFSKLHMYFILFATTVWLRVKLLRYNGSILIVNYLFSKFCSTCMQRIVRASSCLDAILYSRKLSREKTFVVLWLFASFLHEIWGQGIFWWHFLPMKVSRYTVHRSVAEHWLHKPVSWLTFLYFCLKTKYINESYDHDDAIRFILCLHFS